MQSCFFKIFIYTSLIWILQYSNNWKSYIFWNYKNKPKNISFFVTKRFLSEGQNVPDETGEGTNTSLRDAPKSNNQEVTAKVQSQLNVQQRPSARTEVITQQIEDENYIERKGGSVITNSCSRILPFLINNLGNILLFFFIFLALSATNLSISQYISDSNSKLINRAGLLMTLSLIFTLIFLLYEEVQKKVKGKH